MLAEQPTKNISAPDDAVQESISAAEQIMKTMPQAPGMETAHFFTGGMYCRKIKIPKDHVIVSKVHKTEHFFIGCVGRLMVAGQGEKYILSPGDVVPSEIGTKRMVVALDDVVVMTVHKTDVDDVEKLEEELMMRDESSMYDVNNQPKNGVLVHQQKKLKGD